ncbi:MAG: hypothetical protein HF982_14690 [Desulfobacteraceae bacterium]|nr:hypothetical protein [Desulfobacteraceae bacterium]MBC2720804.1 hypothetical protein [Desulfobacteraceae bacterium]
MLKKPAIAAIILGLFFTIFSAGCSGQLQHGPPEWVVCIPERGAVGGAGWSPIPGKQKEIARARALVSLATELGGAIVTIRQEIERKVVNDTLRATMISNDTITVKGIKIKGKIIREWHDPKTGRYYVWMEVK